MGLSPEIHRTLNIPILFKPTISDCNPQRVVSRAAICSTGSALRSIAVLLQAILDIFGCAEEESVKLMAETHGLTSSISLISLPVLAPRGGVTSVATTNSPFFNLLSSSETGSLVEAGW